MSESTHIEDRQPPKDSGATPTPQTRNRRWPTLLVATVGVALTAIGWSTLHTHHHRSVEQQFEADAGARVRSIERQFEKDVEFVRFFAAFYAGSRDVTRKEFADFANRTLKKYDDIQMVIWAPRVAPIRNQTPSEALLTFEKEVHEEKDAGKLPFRDYRVKQRATDGRWMPAASRSEYFPVLYVQPKTMSPALGYDISSDPSHKAVLLEACAKADVLVTGPFTLGPEGEIRDALIAVAPVYKKGVSPAIQRPTPDDLQGFVVALVLIGGVVDHALSYFEEDDIEIQLRDKTALGEQTLYRHRVDADVPNHEDVSSIRRDFVVEVSGREWVADCTASAGYLSQHNSRLPLVALLAGLLMTTVVALYTNTMVGRATKVKQLVSERSAEIQRTNEELKRQIAERERAETVIRDSEALYSSLVENLPVHVLRKDLKGHFTFANKSFCQLVHRPLEEIVGKTDFDLYPRELAEKYQHDDQWVAATGQLFEDEEENKKDGENRYVHVLKSAVRDARGRIIGTQVVFWDVTKRKKAEAALEQERYLLHALMDNLPHNIYFKDRQSRFMRINRALAENFGLPDAAEAIGKSDFDFFTEEHARQARSDEEEIMRTGQPVFDKEERETWRNRQETWAASTKLPLYDEHGEIVGTFGISRDITVQKQAAEALRAAKEAAESASRAKSDFLANMSHEIRTPLNAVLGMTELLLETNLDPSQFEYLRMIQESGESLLLLINDILDFSKIEAGKMDLERITFDLRETLGDTMKSLAVRAHGKGLELACQIHPDVPDSLQGDPGRLRQVVVNLVGNAIKFTERGEVVLDVQCQSQTNDEVVLHFDVRDTGIGIAADKQAIIFGAFEQADTSTTRRFGGTGLGLAISSRLVDFMGGRIWVHSDLGRGSTFHFTARFKLAPVLDRLPPPRLTALRGMRVLVVDDNATNRLILQEMLASWEMTPTVVPRAEEAIEKLRHGHQADQPFALVITDANMPEMDGFALAERIKQDRAIGSTVIMMLTSGDRPGDVTRCEDLGIAAYLLKPVKQSELFDAIIMALGIASAEEPEQPHTAAQPPPHARPLRILLAEDSLVNQKLVIGLLGRQGHAVTVANNGREAVTAIESRSFDLVLMDVQMPEMDGLEATATIRAAEKHTKTHVPIVAMTAHALKGDRERCLQAGMDDYIAKPIRGKRLVEVMQDVLARFAPPSPHAQTLPPAADVLNWSDALSTVKGDGELLRTVAEAFLEEVPRLMHAIREAIHRNDAAALRVAAHTLKGASCHFGAGQAFDHAYQLEKMGQSGRLDAAAQALTVLEDDVAKLTDLLVNYVRGTGTVPGSP